MFSLCSGVAAGSHTARRTKPGEDAAGAEVMAVRVPESSLFTAPPELMPGI